MWRTVLLVLFSFIDLSSCDQVTDDVVRVTGPVVDTQISATTMPTTTTTDTATDKEVLVDTTTSIFNSDGYDVGLTSEETTEATLSTSYFDDSSYMNMNYSSCEIRNVTHKSDTNSIELEWEDCGDNYDVGLMKAVSISPEIPHFRRLNESSTYNFTKLAECTAYNISVASDSDKYLETIRTLPREIQDIETFVSNNMTYVNWSLPESQDCRTYVLQINNGEAKQTRDNSVEMSYDFARCTTIQISAVDTSNTTGNVSKRTVPGAVTDFVPVFNHNSITLNWNPPEDDSCVTGYEVQLDEETPVQLGVANTTYTYGNLAACMEYTVRVAALSETDPGQYSSVTNKTDTPSTIEKVEGLTLILSDATTMRASWEPPSSQSACITDYAITMWDQNHDTVNYKTTDTYYDFTPLVPCKEYHVMVMPRIGTNDGASETANMTIDAAATNPPTLRYTTTSKTSCSIHLQMDSYSVNMCNITMVIVNCTAKGNEPHDWIIDERHIEHSHTDSKNSRQVSVVVDELSEYTIYDCYAYDVNTGGESSQSASISFRTNEDVPSAPQKLTYTVDDDSILITWEKPFKIPGTLKNYHIIVEEVGPLYYIPENCSDVEASIDEDTDELEFRFNNFSFHYRYNVSVTASTEAGHGEAASIDMRTPTGAPEVPIEVTHKFETSAETSSLSLMVKWARPCHTKGDLKEFQWTLVGQPLGQPLEDGNDHIDNGTVMANKNETDTNYILRIPDIQARYFYTFTIAAYTTDGVRGEEFNITGESPDGFPSAPENLTVGDIQATSANISWAAPLITNGEIVSYLLIITTTGPSHYIPEGCVIDHQDAFKYTLNSTQLNYVSWEFMPHFQYTVSISAATTAGYGPNASVDFTTSQAEPPAPIHVSNETHNVTEETNRASITINWKLPCNTNGTLKNFVWNLVGHSLEDSNNVTKTSGNISVNEDPTNIDYETTLDELFPYHSYKASIAAAVGDDGEILGDKMEVDFVSHDGYPSAPTDVTLGHVHKDHVYVHWKDPSPKNGVITRFKVILSSNGPLYDVPEGCVLDSVANTTEDNQYVLHTFKGYTRSNYNYTVGVAASTKTGYGPQTSMMFTTPIVEPDPVQNISATINDTKQEIYEASAILSFDKSCNLHDDFSHYIADIVGQRKDKDDHNLTQRITEFATDHITLPLQPEFTYFVQIETYTKSGRSSATNITFSFTAPAGVPAASTIGIERPVTDPTNATFRLSSKTFDDSQGEIKYYAIIISAGGDPTAPESGGEYGFWDSSSWPKMGFWSSTAEKYEYQVTPNFWAPFKDTTDLNYTYMIGEGNCSSASNVYCNGPLRPNTHYGLRVRGFTEAAYRDTQVIYFTTPSDRSYLALILGVIFGALAAVLVLLFIFVLWRRRKKEAVDAKEAVVVVQSPKPPAIPKSRFEDHCLMFEDNRNELKAEYSHLDRLSAAEKPSSDVAMADNNKKKNRYINIMAYDDTRVKLTTDNNDNYEDYINASYIRGYSGNYEYIATQGPMESTLEDFWRMILQEEVGLIVMVAQFVEQSKQKCYKYFPEKEETMIVGNEIHVKCTSEADMTDYVTRNLIVEKDDEQMIIKHLQFMLWPDFGCPTTTHSMLEFRDIMRRHIEVTKTKAVIHCSAGVGRTGTLITIDILLQKIDNSNDDIDVFGTVLDLRRQRTHMVQTEKQYEYIHKCLRDYLIKPKQASDGIDNYEPIYENVAIINGYMDTNRRDHENNVSTENLIRLKEL